MIVGLGVLDDKLDKDIAVDDLARQNYCPLVLTNNSLIDESLY